MAKRILIDAKKYFFNLDNQYDIIVTLYGLLQSETETTYRFTSLEVEATYNNEVVAMSYYRPDHLIKVRKYKEVSETNQELMNIAIKNDLVRKATDRAFIHVVTQGQEFEAEVVMWNEAKSEGTVKIMGIGYVSVYGCNATNSLTYFNETCCISLNQGDTVRGKLSKLNGTLTFIEYNGIFDKEKSSSLDHSKLAFLKQDGELISGLGVDLIAFMNKID